MYAENQTTLLNDVSFFGKPKNMERIVNVKLLPAEADFGIVFKRTDLKENNIIKVNYNNAFIENDRLVLKNSSNIYIHHAEVLLASLWASRIDNVLIEIDGDSIPFINGTSESFIFLLTIARTKELEKTRSIFKIKQDISMRIDNFEISIKPYNSFSIEIFEQDKHFKFDNSEFPYKDWLSRISENSNEQLKYNTILTIAIIFVSGFFCAFSVELKNFSNRIAFDFFKNFFIKR